MCGALVVPVAVATLLAIGAPGRAARPAAAHAAEPSVGSSAVAHLGDGGVAWRYQPPVAAPVADPFRPPPEPWLPGNRGIEYRTPAGSVVRAIGPGTVTFAGQVAGTLVVTVLHPDGLRSSYVHLGSVAVRAGDHVDGGATVGRSTERLHLGVRRGEVYVDPAGLWGRPVVGHVVLVPVRARPGPRARVGPVGAVGRPAAPGRTGRASGADVARIAIW